MAEMAFITCAVMSFIAGITDVMDCTPAMNPTAGIGKPGKHCGVAGWTDRFVPDMCAGRCAPGKSCHQARQRGHGCTGPRVALY